MGDNGDLQAHALSERGFEAEAEVAASLAHRQTIGTQKIPNRAFSVNTMSGGFNSGCSFVIIAGDNE